MLAIHQSESTLTGMDDWNTRQHSQSGLLQRVQESRLSAAEAEAQTLQFLKQYAVAGKSPMWVIVFARIAVSGPSDA